MIKTNKSNMKINTLASSKFLLTIFSKLLKIYKCKFNPKLQLGFCKKIYMGNIFALIVTFGNILYYCDRKSDRRGKVCSAVFLQVIYKLKRCYQHYSLNY